VTDIRLRRIYEPPAPDDGARVLVDRVWPRGVSKDEAALTLWLKDVAPSTALRTWFGHDPARWSEFRDRYRQELEANGEAVERLRALTRAGRVTLLYSARDEAHNQAVALAEFMQETEREVP
jgi:uncharacterized protein YeaO (DUF488 family)